MRQSLPLMILLASCSPLTEENAPERAAETYCRKQRQCNLDAYDDLWDRDFDECVDANQDALEFILGVTGFFGAELDLDEVRSCLGDVRRASCDEFNAGDVGPDCNDIFTF
jgi:hypothetical protein